MAARTAPAATAATAASLTHTATTPGLRHSVWDVAGQPTEVLELPAASEKPDVHLLVVPGNPGAAPYYEPFMLALHRQLGGRAAVSCPSNLGMDCQGLTPRGRVYSLEEQVAHKQALLRERLSGPGRPPVVMLGHSIGAYMCIHALHRLERGSSASSSAEVAALDAVAAREWEHPDAAGASLDGVQRQLEAERQAQARRQQLQQEGQPEAERPGGAAGVDRNGSSDSGGRAGEGASSSGVRSNVVKVIGLYPFLQVDPNCSKQRRLQRITPHHALLGSVAGALLGAFPMPLRRGLVRALTSGMDAHAVDVTARVFATASCVENGLYMGQTEFEALAAPADWWLLRSLGSRFAMFAAPDDAWFKRWKWDALHREVPGVEAHWIEDQTHAFCVSTQQSEELAARIAPIVEAALPQPKL
ncbi:hypothetical protein ABPG77_006623 [Micractinium sp. CCAP 211/92]